MFTYAQDWLAKKNLHIGIAAPPSPSPELLNLFTAKDRNLSTWSHCRDRYFQFRRDQYQERGLAQAFHPKDSVEYPHDAGSWVILVSRSTGEVIGSIAVRLFQSSIVRDWVYSYHILGCAEPRLAAEYSRRIDEFFDASLDRFGACAEVSNWAVAGSARRSPVSLLLVFGAAALCYRLGPHAALALANVDSKAFEMLRSMGGQPLRDESGQPLESFYQGFYRAHLGLLEMSAFCLIPKCGINEASVQRFFASASLYVPPESKTNFSQEPLVAQ